MPKVNSKEVKDKKVKAFKAVVGVVSGFERVTKQYIHSKSSGGLWAFVRHMSGRELYAAKAVQSKESVVFKFAYSSKITTDLYLEFAQKTYKVVAIDPYKFDKTDLTVRAEEVAPPVYDKVTWGRL